MTPSELFRHYFDPCPLVAIIRGVTPAEVEAIGGAIIDAGIRIVEVPLNSPEPLKSIEILAKRFGSDALIGGGTVLSQSAVDEVKTAGGRLIVSPNTDIAVIQATIADDLVSCPGYFTPSEGFAALAAGAHALKLFPAEAATPSVVKAQQAVLPAPIPLLVVGGINVDNMQPWLDAGANGFGLGSALYKPGQSAEEAARNARAFVERIKG